MANMGNEFFLYVANFAQNRIEVFDKNWGLVSKPFVDPNMPTSLLCNKQNRVFD
jgi:hypothetical protein